MSDWRSYDRIADSYEALWTPRFVAVAERLLSLAPRLDGLRVLDLGAGTGAVARAFGEALPRLLRLVGCDLSHAMLSRARLPPPFRAVVGDMLRLPLRSASFDLVTANFALSHVADHQAALGEVLRVLDRPGTLLASSWVPSRDPVVEAWGELVDRVLGAGGAERAMKEVSPLEAFYGVRENLEQSFSSAGFRAVRIEETSLSSEHTVEQYVTERSLNAAGRLARQTLGEAGWPEFASKAQVELRRRLGGRIAFSRSVLLAAATVG